MKILFYVDPAKLFDSYSYSVAVLHDHLLRFCGSALLRSEKVELKAIVSEVAVSQNRATGILGSLDVRPFPYGDLRRVFPDGRSLADFSLRNFRGDLTDDEQARFSAVVRGILGDWEPDIVISFPANFGPVRRTFPKALCLVMENGVFSRAPLPRTLRFDALGLMHGFPNRYAREIFDTPLDEGQRRKVAEFVAGIRDRVSRASPWAGELAEARARYRHLLLCPVPYGNFYGEAAYDDQFLWLEDVLERVPADCGVVITFHGDISAQVNGRTIGYFRERHPNLLAFESDDPVRSQSLWFFPFVDAILNCETMTGLLGSIFGPKVVALDRTYSGWFADGIGLESLPQALSSSGRDRAGLIHWLMTHFTVYENRFDDPDWYCRYFEDKLARYRRSGVGFGLYGQIEDFGAVADDILSRLDRPFESTGCAAGVSVPVVPERHSLGECLRWKICESLIPWHRDRYAEKLRRCGF